MISKNIKISVQIAGWYGKLYGKEEKANEAFRFIRDCGFDALELGLDHTLSGDLIGKGIPDPFYDADIEELKERFRPAKEAGNRYGISFGQAHAPFPLYVEGADAINDYLIRVIEKECAICQYLECPALVVHPYICADKEKEREINLAMYRKMIPAGKQYGVTLCLENLFRWANGRGIVGACGEAEEACWYIDILNNEAGEDIFGFCFDVGHANISGRDIRQDIRTLGKRLKTLHIHDNDGWMDLHQIPYTQHVGGLKTATDWEGFIEGLRDIHYEGSLNFETWAALEHIPHELIPSMMKLIYDVGSYFKSRVEGE